jgi:lipoate-protein ligase A
MATRLRIISDSALSPEFNMAADLFLFESCVNGNAVIVRFYEWARASITVGYMQKASEVLDLRAMAKNAAAWVRRPTGGRTVLHENDITYSCIFPAAITDMGKTVMDSYAVISKCLLAGLTKAGIQCLAGASFDQLRETRRDVKLPCFLAPNRNEIMVKGRKLVGSAQKRSAQAVLQHGSMPIDDNYRKLPDYLRLSEKQRSIQKELLAAKSICLREIDPVVNPLVIRRALMEGFIDTLPFEPEEKAWTPEEREKINALAQSREFKKKWMTA